jgi:AraC-like DNA-binding protein
MNYSTIIPDSDLQSLVECYWSVEGNATEQQKIIPDGFPEAIFHFGDPYEFFHDDGTIEIQEKTLISGQISKPITLRPTGRSDVFGIKFKPAALWKIFGVDMSKLKDQVLPLPAVSENLHAVYNELEQLSLDERTSCVDIFLKSKSGSTAKNNDLDKIIARIEKENGNISIVEICALHSVTPRTLQRMFQQQVGVTAKQFSRITRFKKVYSLLQQPSLTKSDSLFLTGYFDQPHFNKEFRKFTHENPEKWFAEKNSFSNLFMNR